VAFSAVLCGAGFGLGLLACRASGSRAKHTDDGKCQSSEDGAEVDLEKCTVSEGVGPKLAECRCYGSWLQDSDEDDDATGVEVVQLSSMGSCADALLEEFGGIWFLEGNSEQLWAVRPNGRMFFNGHNTGKSLAVESDSETGEPRLFCPQSRKEGVEIDMRKSEPHDRDGRQGRLVWTRFGEEVAVWYRSAKTSLEESAANGGVAAKQVRLDLESDDEQASARGDSLLEDFFGLWYAEGETKQCWAIKHTGHAFLNGRTTEWTFEEEADTQTGEPCLVVPQRRKQGVEIDMQASDAHSRVVWMKDGEQVAVWHRQRKAQPQPDKKPLPSLSMASSRSGVTEVMPPPSGRKSHAKTRCRTLMVDDVEDVLVIEPKRSVRFSTWHSSVSSGSGVTEVMKRSWRPQRLTSCHTLFSDGSEEAEVGMKSEPVVCAASPDDEVPVPEPRRSKRTRSRKVARGTTDVLPCPEPETRSETPRERCATWQPSQ